MSFTDKQGIDIMARIVKLSIRSIMLKCWGVANYGQQCGHKYICILLLPFKFRGSLFIYVYLYVLYLYIVFVCDGHYGCPLKRPYTTIISNFAVIQVLSLTIHLAATDK